MIGLVLPLCLFIRKERRHGRNRRRVIDYRMFKGDKKRCRLSYCLFELVSGPAKCLDQAIVIFTRNDTVNKVLDRLDEVSNQFQDLGNRL